MGEVGIIKKNALGVRGMDVNQGMELAQALKLSPTLLQSMGILQMNTLELAGYLKELALENPVMEYDEAGESLGSWESFASQVPWLGDAAGSAGGEPMGSPDGWTARPRAWRFCWRSSWSGWGWPRGCWRCASIWWDCWMREAGLARRTWRNWWRPGYPGGFWSREWRPCRAWTRRGWGRDPLGVPGPAAGAAAGDHGVALAICREHLELLGAEQYGALARKLGVSLEQVRAAAREIRGLDPDPAGSLALPPAVVEYVRPDAWVAEIDGELKVL